MTKKEIVDNINNFTRQQLIDLMTEIADKNQPAKRYQDGSYEMSMNYDGYYILSDKLNEMEKCNVF